MAVWVGVRNKVCGSELCGSELCGLELCGSFVKNEMCGSELCGSKLCGSEWELKWWEGGSEKWGWIGEKWADRTVFMSGSEWETEKENSPCVECVDRGVSSADQDWEMNGSELGSFCASSADRGASMCGSFCLARCVGRSSQALREAVHVWERQCVWERNGKCLKWKFGLKLISVGFCLFYGQIENIFSLTQFTMPTKHAIFWKMIFEFHFQPKQMDL